MSDELLQWMLTTAAALEWADPDGPIDLLAAVDDDEWHDRELCDCLECENWREAQLSHALGSGGVLGRSGACVMTTEPDQVTST